MPHLRKATGNDVLTECLPLISCGVKSRLWSGNAQSRDVRQATQVESSPVGGRSFSLCAESESSRDAAEFVENLSGGSRAAEDKLARESSTRRLLARVVDHCDGDDIRAVLSSRPLQQSPKRLQQPFKVAGATERLLRVPRCRGCRSVLFRLVREGAERGGLSRCQRCARACPFWPAPGRELSG